jgi:hypothetical protein
MQTVLIVAFICRHFYIVGSYIYLSATKATYCCVSIEIMVTRTRHNIPLYLYCLSYLALQMLPAAMYGPLVIHVLSVSMLRTLINAFMDSNYRLQTPLVSASSRNVILSVFEGLTTLWFAKVIKRRCYVDGKVITAYPMKAYKGRRGIAPHILNLVYRCRWVVKFKPRPLYPQERTQTFIE